MIAIARSQTTQIARHPRALTLSAALHVLVALAWLIAPTPKRDLGAGAMTVQLLVEAPPPAPEPPAPEPRPEPAKPEPAKPQPLPMPKPAPVKPAPKAAPRAPAPAPTPTPTVAAASTTSEAAQPVMSSEPIPTPAAEIGPAAPAVTVGAPAARSVERDDYLRMVWSRILRHRPEKVPFAGTTRLRFILAADGALVAVEVAETSGSGLLDRAALDAVRRAAPFPPPPALSADALTFEIPFQFR